MEEALPWRILRGVLPNPKAVIEMHGEGVEPATVTVDADGNEAVDESIRKALGKFFHDDDLYDWADAVFENTSLSITPYWDDMEPLHIVKYEPGGKFDWHSDNDLTEHDTRKLTIVAALNDEFEGGGLEFFWPTLAGPVTKIDLAPGDAVVFPSVIVHRGLPTTSGERWILIAWATGDQYV